MNLWRDYALMRRLRASWRDVQDLPYEVSEVFEAFGRGEDRAEHLRQPLPGSATR